jgi:hypothetical protein
MDIDPQAGVRGHAHESCRSDVVGHPAGGGVGAADSQAARANSSTEPLQPLRPSEQSTLQALKGCP